MSLARSLSGSLAFAAATGAIYAAFAAAARLAGEPGRRRARRLAMRAWARAVAAIAGMRVAVEGDAPRPPFLLVANHLGYMDVVALATALDCVFVARGDLARWPVLGRLCRGVGTIFVDRERRADVARAGAEIAAAIDRGDGVVLFAEGTSTAGAEVRPFRPSLLGPAASRRMPVHYASITYRTPAGAPPAHRAVCWWGDMPFAGHLFALFGLGRVDAVVRFGAEPVADGDRKRLAARLRDEVASRFTPVVSPEAR